MKENAEKLTDADRQPLNSAIEKVKSALAGTDLDPIKTATTELEQAYQGFSKTLYEKTAASGAAGATGGEAAAKGSNADDDAIDAEFEVK